MRFLLLLMLLPGLALSQSAKDVKDAENGWETRKECWRDGTVENCRGQLVERKTLYQRGVPTYLEFWEKKALVGLALNSSGPYVQCDKLEENFVCEFTSLPIPAKGFSDFLVIFEDREALMEVGVDALEIYRLNLPWEVVRVVAIESDGKAHLSVPLENRPQDLKKALLNGTKKKEKGTTHQFYVVPRIFGLGEI